MSWTLITFNAVSGAALLCYTLLLGFTLRSGVGRRANRYFVTYLASMMLWSFGAVMMYVDRADAVVWQKVLMVGTTLMPLTFYGFVQGFRGQRGRDPVGIVGVVVMILMLMLNAFGYLFQDVIVSKNGLIGFRFGPAMPAFGIYYLSFLFLSALYLRRDFKRTQDFETRNRIRYVLLGMIFIVIGGVTNSIPSAGAFPLDITSNLINALLITYAISRYHLLDLGVIVRRGLVYSSSTALVVAGYLVIVFLGVDLLHLTSGARFMLALLVATLVGVVLQPGRDRVQAWLDQRFFHEKYDAVLMLQRLSRQVASVLDLQRLAELILDEVTGTMQVSKAILLIQDPKAAVYAPLAERGFGGSLTLRVEQDSPIAAWLTRHENVLTAGDLAVRPQFKGLWRKERAELAASSAELFIGLRIGGDLVGILALGPKRSEAPYTPDEQRTLETLANQTAVAVQNARLYGIALEEKERAQTILQAAFSGMIVVDEQMRITVMNPSAEAITGYWLQDLRGKPLSVLLELAPNGTERLLTETLASGTPLEPVEVTLNTPQRRRDLLLGATPLRDGFVLNFTDITRLKEVDRLKSDIVANVSHELRGPLTNIKMYAELLLEEMDGEDRTLRHRFLSVIDEETNRLATFITEMLDLSRLESGHIELDLAPVAVGMLMADVARSLELQANVAGVTIWMDTPVDLPLILIDRFWMYSALSNLLSNAIKFSPRGARVEMVAREVGPAVLLEVADHGAGIPAEDLPHLFTKFYRGAAARQPGISGSGLGLVLAKEAIELHHGALSVETEASQGTRFVVTLPVVQTETVARMVA